MGLVMVDRISVIRSAMGLVKVSILDGPPLFFQFFFLTINLPFFCRLSIDGYCHVDVQPTHPKLTTVAIMLVEARNPRVF